MAVSKVSVSGMGFWSRSLCAWHTVGVPALRDSARGWKLPAGAVTGALGSRNCRTRLCGT